MKTLPIVLTMLAALLPPGPARAEAASQCAPSAFPTRLDPGEALTLANCATISNPTPRYLVVDQRHELQGGLHVSFLGNQFDVEGVACRVVPGGINCVVPTDAPVVVVALESGQASAAVQPSERRLGGGQTLPLGSGGQVVNDSRWTAVVHDYGDLLLDRGDGELEPRRQLVLFVPNVRLEPRGGASCRPFEPATADCLVPPGGTVALVNS